MIGMQLDASEGMHERLYYSDLNGQQTEIGRVFNQSQKAFRIMLMPLEFCANESIGKRLIEEYPFHYLETRLNRELVQTHRDPSSQIDLKSTLEYFQTLRDDHGEKVIWFPYEQVFVLDAEEEISKIELEISMVPTRGFASPSKIECFGDILPSRSSGHNLKLKRHNNDWIITKESGNQQDLNDDLLD